MIVYLARDIPAFVMYCVNGEPGSSLLIESTDSMIMNVLGTQKFCYFHGSCPTAKILLAIIIIITLQ